MAKIQVKKIRSEIGHPDAHRKVLRALGLRKMNKVKVFNDNNCIRGMINKVSHFIEYKLIAD
jgi:large subunit ribosomal protein L30